MKKILFFLVTILLYSSSIAQLNITPFDNAQAFAQRLVGDGITISNVTFTGNSAMGGYFRNISGTNIDIDSGIVLTTGRARSSQDPSYTGVNNLGTSQAQNILASTSFSLPGDPTLAAAINQPVSNLRDACILEFDFVPLGDTIRFRYVFSSEEYDPSFVCTYNDAFGFFISGPGFTGTQNIALVPNTTIPVSIINVNDVLSASGIPLCPNNTSYYVDNTTNTRFTHDGHTAILTAIARVQPCQTYHLKLVISDFQDNIYDSGVFLEAKSLTSNAFQLTNLTQIDPSNNQSYLVEGCQTGSLRIRRQSASLFSQSVFLTYGGTAQNGVDVQQLPNVLTIPSGQTDVFLDVMPTIDFQPEGIEDLRIYIMAPCTTGQLITDSSIIYIRDYDLLGITAGNFPTGQDSIRVCRNAPIQFSCTPGYTTYLWNADPTLTNININNPVATPTQLGTTYIATATVGTCNARDSVYVRVKDIEFISKTDVICGGASTGQIKVGVGSEWLPPVEFSLNGISWQSDSTFNNLPIGNYWVKVRDGSGCVDSISVVVAQANPTLAATSTTQQSTCTGLPDGVITVNPTGGQSPYMYSIDNGTTYQNSNQFNVVAGTYNILIKDFNNCSTTQGPLNITMFNNLAVNVAPTPSICEGSSTKLNAVSASALTYEWQPATALSSTSIADPVASPTVTTQYIVTVTQGICVSKDTIVLNVNPAPKPDAGKDVVVCYGANTRLNAGPFAEYFWSPPTYLSSTSVQNPQVIKPQNSITYYLKVKDANGCISLIYDSVDMKVTPPVKMTAGKDTMVAIGQPVQLWAYPLTGSTIVQYSWSPVYGLNNPFTNKPIATLDRDMTYVVKGITAGDCEGFDTINVKVFVGPEIYVPTAFTPNGDGMNETLKPYSIGIKTLKYFKIYNRWGNEVFMTNKMNVGWDGKVKGEPQPNGSSYVWVAEAIDYTGKPLYRKGMFTMVY